MEYTLFMINETHSCSLPWLRVLLCSVCAHVAHPSSPLIPPQAVNASEQLLLAESFWLAAIVQKAQRESWRGASVANCGPTCCISCIAVY